MENKNQFRLLLERRFGPFFLTLFVAAFGFLASLIIPKAPAADPTLAFNWNPFSETWKNLKFAKGNRTVFLSQPGSWRIAVDLFLIGGR